MHVQFQRFLIGFHLLCLCAVVCSRKSDKVYTKPGENEIFEKTHVITVKFPKIDYPANTNIMDPFSGRRRNIKSNVELMQENCQSKTFKTELNQLRQKIKCEPRDTIVDLVSPFGDIITPNAVVVKRCGGMCSGSKRCLPVQRREAKFYVKTIKVNQMYCSSILVTEDTMCKCACQQNPTDCNENQFYNKERCACVCKNEKDEEQCRQMKMNENLQWDEQSCSCICQQSRSCTTGTYWMENECRCVKKSP